MVRRARTTSYKNVVVFSIALITSATFQGCSPGDRLRALVEKGKFEEAAKVYSEHKEDFRNPTAQNAEYLNLIAENLNKSYEPALQSSIEKLDKIAWPEPVSEWARVKKLRIETFRLLTEYDTYDILEVEKFTSPNRNKLAALYERKVSDIERGAKEAFLNYDHFFSKQSFFDTYPVIIERRVFMSDHFEEVCTMLQSADTKKIESFARLYRADHIFNEQNFATLSNLYLSAYFRENTNGGRPGLITITDSIASARKCGLKPSEIPGTKIVFAQIENKKLIENKVINFPVQLKNNFPFEVITIDPCDAATEKLTEAFDYILVLHVLEAKNEHQAVDRDEINSKFQVGTVPVANPAYDAAQARVYDCQSRLNGLINYNSYNPNIFTTTAIGNVRKQLDNAILTLRRTPAHIDQPVYENYTFNRVEIQAVKTFVSRYYILDCVENTYVTNDMSFSNKANFTILYGLHEEDVDRDEYLSEVDSEKELEARDKSKFLVPTSYIIKHYKENAPELKQLISFEAICAKIINDEHSMIKKYSASDPRLSDPRFESIVVILNPAGNLGAGFFVAPDLVLTNLHTVEGVKYVEIKTYNGEETFGKVIRYDIRLDLALIKVQARAKPLKFYDGTKVNPGVTVEAVGHPKGFEYSISRGVVSAVRRTPSIYAPDADDVLFIQMDAAINPGNSGGPLFLEDRVIGVNTWKMVATTLEGLGFAIHYSEVLGFIDGQEGNER